MDSRDWFEGEEWMRPRGVERSEAQAPSTGRKLAVSSVLTETGEDELAMPSREIQCLSTKP